MKQTLITSACIFLFLVASYVAIMGQHYKQFRRFVKVDDPVKFKYEGKRGSGKVTKIGRKYLHIKTFNIKNKVIIKKVPFNNASPVLFFRYKKIFD